VDWTLAAVIIAELGVDMSVFQSVSQLASWAGVCPGTNESAGKRKSSRVPKGNVYLKTGLVEAPNAASRAKGTYLRDKFYRLKARRGYKRATMAVAHKILVAIYHMLSQQVSYNDLGDLYFEPTYEEFRSRTIWSLSNAFTSAFKDLDPIPQFKATAKLGEFLEAQFSQSF
jgi:hypothetical protein